MDLTTASIMALLVNLILELTKEAPIIKNIPTKIYAIIVSAIVSILLLIAEGSDITLQIMARNMLNSIVVAYIAIFGYDNIYKSIKKYVYTTKRK